MEIFYNTMAPNYEQVAEMGPQWWTEYREMDANYKYAGWTLDLMAYFLEQLIRNEFPEHCDLKTLAVFERILRIEYDTEMSEDERRRTVAAFWAGNGKMNKTTIEGLVTAYTRQTADVWWDEDILVIDFDNTDTAVVSMSMLQRILRRRMPAHIDYRVRCVCTAHLTLSPSLGYWKTVFDQTGTLPGVNIGLALNRDTLEVESESEGYKARRLLMGGENVAGEYPATNIGLSLNGGTVDFEMEADSHKLQFPFSGDDAGETGLIPKTNITLGKSEESMAPEVSVQVWTVEHQMCGEDTF